MFIIICKNHHRKINQKLNGKWSPFPQLFTAFDKIKDATLSLKNTESRTTLNLTMILSLYTINKLRPSLEIQRRVLFFNPDLFFCLRYFSGLQFFFQVYRNRRKKTVFVRGCLINKIVGRKLLLLPFVKSLR